MALMDHVVLPVYGYHLWKNVMQFFNSYHAGYGCYPKTVKLQKLYYLVFCLSLCILYRYLHRVNK